MKVFPAVDDNIAYLTSLLGEGIGLITSKYQVFDNRLEMGILYIQSISDDEVIRNHVLQPLLNYTGKMNSEPDKTLTSIQTHIISVADTQVVYDLNQVTDLVIKGYSALFFENAKSVLILGTRKVITKGVASPENEAAVLGSQESFTDDLQSNMSLLVKRLPVRSLHFEEFTVGTLSQTKVKLIWLEGVADLKTVEEAKRRIQKINFDSINGIGTLAEFIEDRPMSIFPKYRQTERADTVAKSLCDGRFVILCDNSPFAFYAPVMLWDNFKTMDDYEDRPLVGSYLRLVRYVAFLLSTLVSALYLSFVTYNQSIVPSSLALNIAAGREGVPFPTVIELLLMTLSITIIREAGLRMPSSVAYFIGTLAAVLIGQAVVTAGYISPSLIIVITVSTIASFAISTTTLLYPARLLNYFFILLAGFFGIFGVVNGLVIVFWHLITLESFGVPYLYPVLPFDKQGFKDIFVRFPFYKMKERMKRLAPKNRVRSSSQDVK